jgi:hypothetical protein
MTTLNYRSNDDELENPALSKHVTPRITALVASQVQSYVRSHLHRFSAAFHDKRSLIGRVDEIDFSTEVRMTFCWPATPDVAVIRTHHIIFFGPIESVPHF